MRGKILFSAVLLSLSASAFANGALPPAPAAEATDYFSGFYFGIGAGVQNFSSEAKAVVDYDRLFHVGYTNAETGEVFAAEARANNVLGMHSDLGDKAFSGDLFIGYGQVFHSDSFGDGLYAGVELYGRYSKSSPETSDLLVSTFSPGSFADPADNDFYPVRGSHADALKIETQYMFGAAFKGGILVTPKSMIYILLGAEYANFDVDAVHSFYDGEWPNVDGTEQPINQINQYSYTEHKWAFVPGIGFEQMITDNLSLRGQYTYAFYSTVDNGEGHHQVGPVFINHYDDFDVLTDIHAGLDTQSVAASEFKPRIGNFQVGLTYHANGV